MCPHIKQYFLKHKTNFSPIPNDEMTENAESVK